MQLQDLRALLEQGVTRIVFLKADNTVRTLLATLHPAHMPPPTPSASIGRPMAEGHLLVWDMEAKALRSFNVGRLLEAPVLLEALAHDT